MTALFSASDLNALPDVDDVSAEEAGILERIVWGWLKPVLGLSERPATVPDEMFSWAIELAAIAHENPKGLTYYQLGEERSGYSAERRAQILAEVGAGGLATPRPTGCFPPARAYPDPAERCW